MRGPPRSGIGLQFLTTLQTSKKVVAAAVLQQLRQALIRSKCTSHADSFAQIVMSGSAVGTRHPRVPSQHHKQSCILPRCRLTAASSRWYTGHKCRLSQNAAAHKSEYSIEVENLHVQLGNASNSRSILKGVNLLVKRGTLNMLLGPNGCGKSTLLKVLGGLIPSSRGKVETDHPCAFVFQNPDHQVVMPTVAADVAFGLGRYNMPEPEVAELVRSTLKLVNMEEYIYRATHTLSGGQKQRVAIAGALAENPRLLLLDELTTFLDRQDQLGVLEAVRKIMTERNDVTTIWVTHRFEELEYADTVTYMDDGKVVFTGTPTNMCKFLRNLGAPV